MLHGSWYDTSHFVRLQPIIICIQQQPLHRERLARTSLPVRENAHIVPINHILDQLRQFRVDGILLDLHLEDVLEVEAVTLQKIVRFVVVLGNLFY